MKKIIYTRAIAASKNWFLMRHDCGTHQKGMKSNIYYINFYGFDETQKIEIINNLLNT